MKRILALFLAAVLTLTGCAGLESSAGYGGDYVAYADMVYTRPDPEALGRMVENACAVARTSTDLNQVLDTVFLYYDAYDRFYTNYNLACIGYNRDVTDEYWTEEYSFCMEHSAEPDAGLEELYMALAQSPIRSKLEEEYFGTGFFLSYEGEAVWDSGFTDLLSRETELIAAYYALCEEASSVEYYSPAYFDNYADRLCQALIDLVLLRQELAGYLGYGSYVQFAYDFYHYRDYTPAQAMEYMDSIREEMADLYARVSCSDAWDGGYGWCRERDMYDYVRSAAENMGGIAAEAFSLMDTAGLYDISSSETKFDSSFELYLPSFNEPYVFVSPSGNSYDCLSFAHEFGHFATDYSVWGGSWAGTDVLEVFSQGMEYLSLCYSAGADEVLTRYKMADCLAIFVEQSAYASFEHRLYELAPEELTVERVFALYREVMESFGVDFDALGWDARDLVTVPHFYTDPLYIVSYVVSNDAAFQLYQLEQESPGQGLAKWEEHLSTESYYILEFLEEAGLQSPFASGRASQVARTLAQALGMEADS